MRHTRWTELDSSEGAGAHRADLLGSQLQIEYAEGGAVRLLGPGLAITMDPDEARMYGVRLIEAATRSEGEATVRHLPRLQEVQQCRAILEGYMPTVRCQKGEGHLGGRHAGVAPDGTVQRWSDTTASAAETAVIPETGAYLACGVAHPEAVPEFRCAHPEGHPGQHGRGVLRW